MPTNLLRLLPTLCVLATSLPLFGQSPCALEEPFFLPPQKEFCVDSNGVATISFTLQNVTAAAGDYRIEFPDGLDTTVLGVSGAVSITHDLAFSCDFPPGVFELPTEDNPF